MSNPDLSEARRPELVDSLMQARCQVGAALKAGNVTAERGAVWWPDGAPDYNRKMVVNTHYAAWYATR